MCERFAPRDWFGVLGGLSMPLLSLGANQRPLYQRYTVFRLGFYVYNLGGHPLLAPWHSGQYAQKAAGAQLPT